MKSKILVVDDDETIQMVLLDFLTKKGYEVRTACHGQQALLLIDAESFLPDIVVTDVAMAVLDGIGLARQLRMRNIVTEIIFMSGGIGAHTEAELREYSPHYIAKPFSLAALADIIEQLLHAGVH